MRERIWAAVERAYAAQMDQHWALQVGFQMLSQTAVWVTDLATGSPKWANGE